LEPFGTANVQPSFRELDERRERRNMPKRGLVLGAGGNAASAWETGLIAGMADAGVDVRDADVLVGTSAGARVAVQLASGSPLDDLFARQGDPQSREIPPLLDWRKWRSDLEKAKRGGETPIEAPQRVGAFALATPIEDGSRRRDFIASEMPQETWPDRPVLIASVEAETGDRRVFDRTSEIALKDAVTASGAVAGGRLSRAPLHRRWILFGRERRPCRRLRPRPGPGVAPGRSPVGRRSARRRGGGAGARRIAR
jgi:predicted acylesterase/phospholipase RssA